MGVYAKSGVSFQAGAGFILTGNSIGVDWEIDYPSSNGIRIHGVTTTTVDQFSTYPALILDQGPLYVLISTNVVLGDELTIDTSGNFKKRGASDAWDGIALSNGTAGNSCAAIIFGLTTPLNIASLTQGDILTRGASAWQRLSPSTAGQVLTSNGAGAVPTYQTVSITNNLVQTASAKVTADQTTTSSTLVDLTGASVTISTQASSKVLVNASYSMSNSSALGSLNRIALVIDGTVEPQLGSSFQSPLISNFSQGGSISTIKTGLSAGSHTFKLQWSNTTGTTQCRPQTGAPNTEHASITVMEVKV